MTPRSGWPRTLAVAGLIASLAAPALPAGAQSLRGSRASVGRMYVRALAHDLTFFKTGSGVRKAATRGRLVRLTSTRSMAVSRGVKYPWVLPTTRLFVTRLSAQYRAACGQQLVVTGATRPESYRLANASDRSVHPTGMAIDLRTPRGKCRTWLRRTLLSLERQRVIEATEERRPAHFHVAVFPEAYQRYAARRAR